MKLYVMKKVMRSCVTDIAVAVGNRRVLEMSANGTAASSNEDL
jgi:hypothetical protein